MDKSFIIAIQVIFPSYIDQKMYNS